MKKFIVVLCVLIFTGAYAADQKNITTQDEPEKDINLRAFAKAPIQNLTLSRYVDSKQVGSDIEYDANTTMDMGIGGSYKSFGGSFTLSSSSLEDEAKYGKSESRDYQFYYYTDHFGADLYYQKYKGYYLSNPSKFGYAAGDASTLRPDLKVQNTGTNIYYAFSDDYSLSASFKQMEKSYESAGSWLVSLSLNDFRINGDYSLIPLPVQAQFGDFADYRGGKYRSISAGGGYGYLAAFNSGFYLGGALMIGLGYMYAYEDTGSSENSASLIAVHVNLKVSAGYNGDTFYCGLTGFCFDNGTAKTTDEYTNILCIGGEVELFTGIRI